jgi:hypothetical protein
MDNEWVTYGGGPVQHWHRGASRIRIGQNVRVIPIEAFMDCSNLIVVDLGNVTTISDRAFHDCRWLECVTSSAASAVKIGEHAFSGCENLRHIDFSNVTAMRAAAFSHCRNLTEVRLNEGLQCIEKNTFQICYRLAHVNLSQGIRKIKSGAFSQCKALSFIDVPSSVTDIELGAFQGCTNLSGVQFRNGLQCIGTGVFGDCTLLQTVSIPPSVLLVGPYSFQQCKALQEVCFQTGLYEDFQTGLYEIGAGAFTSCYSLGRITIPSSVTVIGCRAFQSCRSLTEVTLHEGVHCIRGEAFDSCHSLTHINIPPVAFVIDFEQSTCQLMRVTMPKPIGRGMVDSLVASHWMQYRSDIEMQQIGERLRQILSRPITYAGKVEAMREWMFYLYRRDVSTLLELAIWKSGMNGNQPETDRTKREAIRNQLGNDMSVIIPSVMEYFGPHQGY